MAISEFLYSKPQITKCDGNWLNDHGKKAVIGTEAVPSMCFEKPCFRPTEEDEVEVT